MTAYNASLFIRDAVESVLKQSFTNFEFIIMDDGSEDDTALIISSFSDGRIITHFSKQNLGVSKQRAKLLSLARGKYINFVDADDILHPSKFEKQIQFLEKNPEISVLGTYVIIIDERGKMRSRLKLKANSDQIRSILVFRNYFVNSSVMFRKAVIPKETFREGADFIEDYLLWWKILQQAKGYNLPGYYTCYRDHKDNMTHRVEAYRDLLDKTVYKLILQDMGMQPVQEELDLHYFISNSAPVKSLDQMKSLRNWLLKLNRYCRAEVMGYVNKTICNRWLKICWKARKNPVLLGFGLYVLCTDFIMNQGK